MKSKFVEFSKDYGLIVAGYSGGDRSIMDVISTLLKNEEYLKNGVYWCIRKESEVSEELRKLMWRERVYFVEIDGFDELFAELYCKFNDGDVLPAAALSVNRRPADVAHKLLASEKAFPSTTDVLRKARERLERQSKRATLVNLIVKPDTQDNSSAFSTPDLSDDDLILLTEIQNLISADQHHQAIEKARESIRSTVKLSVKMRLLRLIVQAHQMLGNTREALIVADELISYQPKNSSHYLRKALILKKRPDRLQCIEEAISKDPYSVDGYLDKARLLASWAKTEYGEIRVDLVKEASQALEKGLVLDPNWRNPCWIEKFDLLRTQEFDIGKRHGAQSEIVEKLKIQNPYSIRVLYMRQKMLSDKDGSEVSQTLLNDIEEARDRAGISMATQFDVIKLQVLAKIGDNSKLEKAIETAIGHDASKDEELTRTVATILRDNFGKDLAAIEVLKEYMRYDFDVDVLVALLHAYVDLKEHNEADQLYEKWHRRLSFSTKHKIRMDLLEARNNYEGSLKEAQEYEDETGVQDITHRLYLYLKLGRYLDADKLARSILEPIHYSPEAAAETVNLEFARKMQGRKVDTNRLAAILRINDAPDTQAACHALLEKKSDMLDSIKKAMKADKTFRYRAAEWPVFDMYRNDPGFIQAVAA
jgi:tetratricopeptide (TPR) repeat protein